MPTRHSPARPRAGRVVAALIGRALRVLAYIWPRHPVLTGVSLSRFVNVANRVMRPLERTLAGFLPTVGRTARLEWRGCPRLVLLSYGLPIWYPDSRRKIGTKHSGLRILTSSAPHKLTPMLGVRECGVADSAFTKGRSTAATRLSLSLGQTKKCVRKN